MTLNFFVITKFQLKVRLQVPGQTKLFESMKPLVIKTLTVLWSGSQNLGDIRNFVRELTQIKCLYLDRNELLDHKKAETAELVRKRLEKPNKQNQKTKRWI